MKRGLLLLPLLALAACSSARSDYPSLLPRAAEGSSLREPVPEEEVDTSIAADPALDAKIAEWRARLAKSATDFAPAAETAERRVNGAKGKAVGSDPWLDAQAALATLDAVRADGEAVVTEMDDAASTRAATGAADYPALVQLHGEADKQLDAQSQRITALQSVLPAAQ